MSLTDRSVRELIAAFRAPEPSPGGGSASALAGAIGAALLAMVAGLPRSKAESSEDELRRARETAEGLCEALRLLVDRDSDAYDGVMHAYRLPKGTQDEKQIRSARIQAALGAAIDAPLEVMRCCAAAIAAAVAVAAHGNRNAASDVRVALELLQAALRGALANVEINLESLKDESRAAAVRAETSRLAREAASQAADALRSL